MANYNYKFNNQNLSDFVYERDWLDKIDLSKSNMWAWGFYTFTQDNSTSIPAQVDEVTNWKKIDFTTFSNTTYAAIKDDGTLWGWGNNTNGAVGDGTTVDRSSPVQIISGGKWRDVSCGRTTMCAIKSDGTLWEWGTPISSLGGNARSSPVQIWTNKTWKMVKAGSGHTIGITTEGYLWGWGENDYGQVGDGTVITKSSPVQLDSFSPNRWKYITATGKMSGAIRSDGLAFSWGYGKNGGLGCGDISRSSPTLLSSTGSISWKQITFSKADNTITQDTFGFGITTDGKLYAWGDNAFGQLGRSNVSDENAPIQVGSSTNWKQVACGTNSISDASTLALKTDDTLWGWGAPASGRLIGISGFTVRSSPVQLGSFSNTKSIVADSVRAFIFNRNYSY
jgi:alpha-tubulin suppressor-like RCC1 family protein